MTLSIAFRSAIYLSTTAIAAWIVGEPLIFPSLGPTAYVLAFNRDSGNLKESSRTIVGGHFCGVLSGLLSYHLIVSPYQLSSVAYAFSTSGLMLSAGAVVALFLTALLMLSFKASHPPACATTLIVSLGILTSWQEAIFIMITVCMLYLVHKLYMQL